MPVRKILSAAVAVVVIASLPVMSAQARRVILVSIDSTNNTYIFNDWHNPDFTLTPNIGKLVANGASFSRAKCTLPSVTQTNHVVMVCGCYPEQIGIPGNQLYNRGGGSLMPFTFPWKHPELIKCDTLFKALGRMGDRYTTAVVAGKDFVGCPITADYNVAPACISESVRRDFPGIHRFPEANSWDSPDEWVMNNALEIIDRKDPDFMLLHLGFVDPAQHGFGHGAAESWAAIKWADHQVGRLILHLNQTGKGDSTLLVVTADHGQSNFWKQIDIREYLEKNGVKTEYVDSGPLSHIFLADKGQLDKAVELLQNHEAISGVWTGDNIDEIHLRTTYTGDIVVTVRPPYKAGVYPGPFGMKLTNFAIGNHGGKLQQYVPLIFSGPGIRKNVILDSEAEAVLVDIAPTISSIMEWPLPGSSQGKVLPVMDETGAGDYHLPGDVVLSGDTTSKKSYAVWILIVISVSCLLAINFTGREHEKLGAGQSLMGVVALSSATSAALFSQFIDLYASIPGIAPDSYLLARWPLFWGTPILGHTAVQLITWFGFWLLFGAIFCIVAKSSTRSRTGRHLGVFPVYFTPLAWALVAVAVFYQFASLPYWQVKTVYIAVWSLGFLVSIIKSYTYTKEFASKDCSNSSALVPPVVTALIFTIAALVLNRLPILLFPLMQLTMLPVGTH